MTDKYNRPIVLPILVLLPVTRLLALTVPSSSRYDATEATRLDAWF